jgi:hypothetical protein
MPTYKVTAWYPMEGEIIVEASDEKAAEDLVNEKYANDIDYKDTGDFFIREVVEVNGDGEELDGDEDDLHKDPNL